MSVEEYGRRMRRFETGGSLLVSAISFSDKNFRLGHVLSVVVVNFDVYSVEDYYKRCIFYYLKMWYGYLDKQ